MRALVAVTCIAVLGAIGYYFWNEYSEARERSEAQKRLEMEAGCRAAKDSKIMPSVVKNCIEQGFLRP